LDRIATRHFETCQYRAVRRTEITEEAATAAGERGIAALNDMAAHSPGSLDDDAAMALALAGIAAHRPELRNRSED
jgi:hypothetical protein